VLVAGIETLDKSVHLPDALIGFFDAECRCIVSDILLYEFAF